METLSPVRSPLGSDLKCKTFIPATAEGSLAHEQGYDADIRIYSDGSGLDNNAGAAAILYKDGDRPRTLRYHLGPLMEHTTFEAEAIGLLLALHLLRRVPGAWKVAIRLDNQAVNVSLNAHKPKPAQYTSLMRLCARLKTYRAGLCTHPSAWRSAGSKVTVAQMAIKQWIRKPERQLRETQVRQNCSCHY